MFDLRAEAEMRLYSEKLAKELADKRRGAPDGTSDDAADTPSSAGTERPGAAVADGDAPAAS
ncbi:hypothetical protein ADK76_14165 [Streptomyces griseoflavus]|uniref:hypothetical protein n=1 Tax=Streptomyces TaxID=1883 RepID=UPI0004CA1CDC|nr:MULTISPECIES: hypothetical protein [Streptomyces]KOG61244.1 hypothetical protein ADK76_14165 [Streptomyces griseoflavus]KOT88514.1 hypothetical protein ADK86_31985 [Streptomyces sp. NRRL F-5755]